MVYSMLAIFEKDDTTEIMSLRAIDRLNETLPVRFTLRVFPGIWSLKVRYLKEPRFGDEVVHSCLNCFHYFTTKKLINSKSSRPLILSVSTVDSPGVNIL